MSDLYGIEAVIAGQMAGKKADDREFPFTISDTDPVTISCTKEELIAAIDAGKTPIGYWRHTQSNGTVIRLFHFMKRFNATDGTNLTFYFSDKTSSGVLDIQADGTIKRTYRNNDGGGASGSANFTFTITPIDGQVSPNLSATRTEMLAALDAGKTLLGYWTETRTILETTDTIKHEFRLESVSGTGASRGLAFVNYEQFYKSTLYVNGNDTISFVDKEVLPAPMTKTEAMTQSVGMDNDGRLWTEPGASGDDDCQTLIVSVQADIFSELTSSSTDVFGISFPDNVTTQEQAQAFVAKIDNALSAGKQIIIKDSSNNTYTPHWVERGKNNNYFLSFMVVNGATLFIFVLLKNAGNLYFSMNNLFKYSLTTISA